MTVERLAACHPYIRRIVQCAVMWKNIDWERGASSDETGEFVNDQRVQTDDLATAQAVSSEIRGTGSHAILIDLDHRAVVLPSSTAGHGHLYIDHSVTWGQLENLLDAMAACGLVEPGYVAASKKRKATYLRLPWVRKGHERDDSGGWTLEEAEAFLDQPPPPADPFEALVACTCTPWGSAMSRYCTAHPF